MSLNNYIEDTETVGNALDEVENEIKKVKDDFQTTTANQDEISNI